MIKSTSEYKKAIVGDTRRIEINAIVDIIGPDITFDYVIVTSESEYSNTAQLHDKEMGNPDKNATLEANRWVLDGSFGLYPEVPNKKEMYAYLSEDICGADGNFTAPQSLELFFSNVSVLQAFSVWFPDYNFDGVPEEFTAEVIQGGEPYFSIDVTGNKSNVVYFSRFTVYNPDSIKITVRKMSLPYRRLRAVEIIPGIYEKWTGSTIETFSVKHQADVSCLSLPYGTCDLTVDNSDRRFEPRNKEGVFKMIEERQGIDVSMAVLLENGEFEYKRLGIFYQYSGGWKTGTNGLTIEWSLVDIIGLLSDRRFIPPETLPKTLGGWVSELVKQLGESFSEMYSVDENYAETSLTAEKETVSGMTCGDVLRYACMATGTFPRADAETGKLTCEPLWNEGNKITLDNLNSYPVIRSNDDLAAIVFTLNDGIETQYVVSGNATASNEVVSVQNPFIKTKEQALAVAKSILASFGGNRIEVVGRGDMSSEIGDVDTVWLNESEATTGRRIQQGFSFNSGVLKEAESILLQADGSFMYKETETIEKSGTWKAPSGVSRLRVILIGKGYDGADGTEGTWFESGVAGESGTGGKVWAGTIDINEQQTFSVEIGENTVFGDYSSENGEVFEFGYTDIASGNSYARTGVINPVPGTGDGGVGGEAGMQGNRHSEKTDGGGSMVVVDNYPTQGGKGTPGATGCVVLYWDKPSA